MQNWILSYCDAFEFLLKVILNLRIIKSFRLEKAFKIIESDRKPNIAKSTTNPCPQAPHLYVF